MARFHTTEQKARYAQKAKAKRLAEKESAMKAQRHKVNHARRQRNYAARLKAQGKVPVRAKTVSFVEDKAATPLVFQDVDRAMANIAPPAKVAPTPTPATVDSLPATPVGHKVTNSHSKTAPSHLQRYGMTSQQRFELSMAKVNAIKEMRISANTTTLENTNRGVHDIVQIGEEHE
jgi:hypothetical protein